MNSDHEAGPRNTWTFFGHWEQNQIVVDSTEPGIVQDTRVDTGTWPEGLWAASGSGATIAEAQATTTAQHLNATRARSSYRTALEQSLTTLGDEWPATLAGDHRTRALTLAFTAGWTAAKATTIPTQAAGIVAVERLPASAILPGDTIRFIDPVHQYSPKDGGAFRRRTYGGWTHVEDVDNSEGDPLAEALNERIANDSFILLRIAVDTIGAPRSIKRFLAVPRYDLVHVQFAGTDQ